MAGTEKGQIRETKTKRYRVGRRGIRVGEDGNPVGACPYTKLLYAMRADEAIEIQRRPFANDVAT